MLLSFTLSSEIIIGFDRLSKTVLENTPGFVDLCISVQSGMLESSVTVTAFTMDSGSGTGFATGIVDMYQITRKKCTYTMIVRYLF